jgi:hypothetical protein
MRISYANVVATLALVLAVGGTAFAASGPSRSPAPAQTLRLCAAKRSGDLRLLASAGARCRSTERAVTVDQRGSAGPAGAAGARGAPGPQGPQGERGPQGPGTYLESPDGRFRATATNDGIVFSGPGGSATFDGRELRADANLAITAGLGLTISNGGALAISSGTSTSLSTGSDFEQDIAGAATQNVGRDASQFVGGDAAQAVAGAVSQSADSISQQTTHDLSQHVGGRLGQDAATSISQQVLDSSVLLNRPGVTINGPEIFALSPHCFKARGGVQQVVLTDSTRPDC